MGNWEDTIARSEAVDWRTSKFDAKAYISRLWEPSGGDKFGKKLFPL